MALGQTSSSHAQPGAGAAVGHRRCPPLPSLRVAGCFWGSWQRAELAQVQGWWLPCSWAGPAAGQPAPGPAAPSPGPSSTADRAEEEGGSMSAQLQHVQCGQMQPGAFMSSACRLLHLHAPRRLPQQCSGKHRRRVGSGGTPTLQDQHRRLLGAAISRRLFCQTTECPCRRGEEPRGCPSPALGDALQCANSLAGARCWPRAAL